MSEPDKNGLVDLVEEHDAAVARIGELVLERDWLHDQLATDRARIDELAREVSAATLEAEAAKAACDKLSEERLAALSALVHARDALRLVRGATNLIREAAGMALTDMRRGAFYEAQGGVDAIQTNARNGLDAIDAALKGGA